MISDRKDERTEKGRGIKNDETPEAKNFEKRKQLKTKDNWEEMKRT